MESKETKRINKKHKRKSWLIVIGSLIILLGMFDISLMFIKPAMQQEQEENALKDFYVKEEQKVDKDDKTTSEEVKEVSKSKVKYDYIAVLKIPKINLEKGLVAKDSKYNNINYGVEILKESDSPDVINGNVIIAGHSGTANISYFRNLHKLNNGDQAIIMYGGKTYNYKLVNSYEITKNGKAKIVRNNKKSTMTLITCEHNTDKQVVFIFEQEGGV